MKNNFEKSLDIILTHEGGFVNHPKDPGGATNKGITLITLTKWYGRYTDIDQLKNISDVTVYNIYKTNYWNKINGDNLPIGIDLMIFDFAVNSGYKRASKYAQLLLPNCRPDGIIGPNTLKKINEVNTVEFVEEYYNLRQRFYESLSTFEYFGRGWSRRNLETKEHALKMIREH